MSDFLIKQIEATEKTIKSLQEHAGSLRSMLEKETPKKWQPVGGEYFVCTDGSVINFDSSEGYRLNGVERSTKEQAERASVEMCRFNRLLALRDELCGDDVVDWKQNNTKFYLYYDHNTKLWVVDDWMKIEIQTPYFPTERHAQRACEMLNSGEVEL